MLSERMDAANAAFQVGYESPTQFADLLIIHARAAFDLMGDDPATNDAKALLQWIKVNGEPEFTTKQAMDKNRRFRTVDRLNKALTVLSTRHIPSLLFCVGCESRKWN